MIFLIIKRLCESEGAFFIPILVDLTARTSFDRKSVILKKQEAKIKDFTHQTGLYRDRAREQSYGFNKSVSQKAVYSNKRALQIAEEMRIIKVQERERALREIGTEKYPLKLNEGHQNKHILGSHSYEKNGKKAISTAT